MEKLWFLSCSIINIILSLYIIDRKEFVLLRFCIGLLVFMIITVYLTNIYLNI